MVQSGSRCSLYLQPVSRTRMSRQCAIARENTQGKSRSGCSCTGTRPPRTCSPCHAPEYRVSAPQHAAAQGKLRSRCRVARDRARTRDRARSPRWRTCAAGRLIVTCYSMWSRKGAVTYDVNYSVGIFLGFVGLSTRTQGPHGAYVQVGGPKSNGPHALGRLKLNHAHRVHERTKPN